MASASSRIAVPGERLGDSKELESGEGTYVLNGSIYAGIVGVRRESEMEGGKRKVDVLRDAGASALPVKGDVVTARVTKVNAR